MARHRLRSWRGERDRPLPAHQLQIGIQAVFALLAVPTPPAPTAAPLVVDQRLEIRQHAPAQQPGSPAQLGVLPVQKNLLVETAKLLPGSARHQHRAARHGRKLLDGHGGGG